MSFLLAGAKGVPGEQGIPGVQAGSYTAWADIRGQTFTKSQTLAASHYSQINTAGQWQDLTTSADLEESIIKKLREIYEPAKAVIKCSSCGQWGARYCECVKCGAPIE